MAAKRKEEPAREVRYTGTSHVRAIREEDWAAVGIEHPELRWERDGAGIPLEQIHLDPDQFARYIEADPELVVVEVPPPPVEVDKAETE